MNPFYIDFTFFLSLFLSLFPFFNDWIWIIYFNASCFVTGATPYVEVRSKELALRVQRGLRLKQPSNIGLPFYQIMVSCWQVDLDERPTFQELVDILQQAFNQSLDYLSFNLFPEFNYERYDPSVELNR